MSERLDTGLRALAERAEHTLTFDAAFTDEVRRRARRGRTTRAVAGAGAAAALVVAGGFAAAALSGQTAPLPPAGTGTPSSEPSTSTSSEPSASASGPLSTLTVLDGWQDAVVDPTVFAGSVITDAVAWQGAVLAVGCDQQATVEGSLDPVDAPMWIGSGTDWRRTGPVQIPSPSGSGGTPVTCVYQVVSSPWGLYATAGAVVLHSADGLTWEPVTGLWDLGAGWATQAFATGDSVTVLSQQASLAESEVATLWRTTDGTSWERVGTGPWPRVEAGAGDDPAVTFDNADVSDVLAVGDGTLVAVGASPGGQFTPTAAAWISPDGATWTPATVDQGDGCYLTAVAQTATGLAGAGWCTDTGQPALWTSTDGTAWTSAEAPVVDLPANSFVEITALSSLGGDTLAVTGALYVGGLEGQGPVQWLRQGGTWTRSDTLAVPYHVVDGTGFWPPTGSGPSAVLLAAD